MIAVDIEKHSPWVKRLAYKLGSRGISEDLYQEGMIALLEAAEKFDPDENDSFKKYSYARVRGSMVDWIRRWAHGSRDILGTFQRVDVRSLDSVVWIDDGRYVTRGDTVGVDGLSEKALLRIALKDALSAREYRIIEAIYFEGQFMWQVGEELGLSESRICQIRTKALPKLREALGSIDAFGPFNTSTVGKKCSYLYRPQFLTEKGLESNLRWRKNNVKRIKRKTKALKARARKRRDEEERRRNGGR